MKITASHLGNIVLTLILVFCLVLIAQDSFAADSEEQIMDGKVEVIYEAQEVPFKERRSDRSIIFGVTMEELVFSNFRSKIDGTTYKEGYKNTPVKLVQGELGLKYNFGLGGISASVIYGAGESKEKVQDNADVYDSLLTMNKKGVKLSMTFDTLFSEPWVAPYISGQMLSWEWSEHVDNLTTNSTYGRKSGTTGWTSAFQGGVLLQLNWLDPNSAIMAKNESGMTNAYLDLFVSQYSATTGSEDPNFQTDMTYGGGFKLEF